jgi:hypothetical protein
MFHKLTHAIVHFKAHVGPSHELSNRHSRVRKIKCDEAKPACTKCFSTGRKCDGYLSPSTSVAAHPSKLPQNGAVITPQSHMKFLNDLRVLDFFQSRTAPALSSTFDSDFWTKTVPTLAYGDPMIRNSVMALSYLHEAFEASLCPLPKRCNVSYLRRQSLLHYILATNQM